MNKTNDYQLTNEQVSMLEGLVTNEIRYLGEQGNSISDEDEALIRQYNNILRALGFDIEEE